MADKLVLLDTWPSPFGMRVRIALKEKGLHYDYKEENLREKSPLLLKMNPLHKKIPVLIHNEKPISESLLIVQYIDEVWKDKSPLLPNDPYERASERVWADYVDKKVFEIGRKLWMTKEEEHEKAKNDFIDCLKVLEGELGDKIYYGGDKMGFLDVAFVPYYSWFYSYETCGKFSMEEICPKLMEWAKKCMEKDSVSESLSESQKIYQFVLKLKQRYGIVD